MLDRLADFERETILKVELEEAQGGSDRALYCIHCGCRVTSTAARCERQGAHVHVFSNPMGVRFMIACFRMAEVVAQGEPSLEHTWFAGHAWQVAHCPACHVHLGWQFTGPEQAVFYGLISDRLQEDADSRAQ